MLSGARRWLTAAFCIAVVVLFFIQNRAAYKGYFSEDDLVNLGWPTYVGNDVFFNGLLTPKFDEYNFRPVPFLYYRYAGRVFGLNFPPYVVALQLIHLANIVLLFLLLRALLIPPLASGIAAVFFALNAASMEAFWKPMYVFDVVCCTFSLATLLLYVHGRWVIGLLTFWAAYKSKEVAVMLPAALAAIEFFVGQHRWKRLLPYFAIAASFGIQAMLHARTVAPQSDYAMSLAPEMLCKALAFYSSAVFFIPFTGFAVLAAPLFVRDKRLYIGLVFAAATLVPLLLLSNRLRAVYWYVPLAGVAIVVAALMAHARAWIAAALAIVWLPLNYAALREKRREVLAVADETRWFVGGMRDFARTAPPLKAVVYENPPKHVRIGADAAIKLVFGRTVDSAWIHDPRARELMREVPMAVIVYDPPTHQVHGELKTAVR